MFCRNCGTDLGGGTKFCPECGVASGEVPGVAPTTPQQPMCQPPLDPGSMASANAQALRQHELQITDDLLRHFSMKQEQYNQYDAVTRNIVDLQRLKAAAMLAWGIVIASICAPGLLMCVGGVVLDHEFGLITPGVVMLILVIVSVIFIISFASINKKRCKTRDEYLERYHQLADELYEHYCAYPNCPIGPEYTNPANLIEIRSTIFSGRAYTIRDAINLLIEDAHRNRMENYAQQTARYAQESAEYSRRTSNAAAVGAFFTAAHYFRHR